MSFQERKTGRKDMRASTRKKSQWQKDEEVKGDFYFFSFFSFLDEPSGKKRRN
jgi:hypothetical protein